jgi:uncharacterized protein (UPF0248 family)
MASNALRDLFNRVRWHGGERGASLSFAVRCRRDGAEVLRQHDGAEVVAVSAGGLTLQDGTFLPYHRIVAVSLDGRTVWPRGRA